MHMGLTNFLGLQAIFEELTDENIDKIVDETVMTTLFQGIIKYD